jgi:hypothetical protein
MMPEMKKQQQRRLVPQDGLPGQHEGAPGAAWSAHKKDRGKRGL